MESLFYQNYLKCIRNEFYIGQSEIAEALYCSVSTYSKMEQGKKEINLKILKQQFTSMNIKKKDIHFVLINKKKKKHTH